MKKIIFLFTILVISIICNAQDYYKITGKVVDSHTKSALPYSTVYLSGNKYCGTVSNETGGFILKIPKNIKANSLKISFLGYKTTSVSLGNLNEDKDLNTIELQESTVLLKEVIVTAITPEELIETAIQKIVENYDIKPIMLNGFYREIQQYTRIGYKAKEDTGGTFKKNEAVFDIYRSPYKGKKEKDDDYLTLIAWRRIGEIKDTSEEDNLQSKGPNSILNDDPLKDIKSSFLWKKHRKKYKFKLKDITTYDNNKVYVIEFDQADNVKEQLYKGTIYIDIASMAFVGIDYMLSPKGAKYNSSRNFLFVEWKYYQKSKKILYKKYNDKWNIYFIQSNEKYDETVYKTYLTKSLFIKNYPDKESITNRWNMNYQFVITGVEKSNIVKFSDNELFNSSTELKGEKNKDREDIWGKYNFIKMP